MKATKALLLGAIQIMSVLLMAAALILFSRQANATGSPKPPPSHHNSTTDANSSSQASAAAGAQATAAGLGFGGAGGAGGNATASGGGAYNAFSDGGSRMYVMPAPVYAAPLPAGLCPKGDSLSWSVGWNFFSYAVSSTRSEIDCLEKVLTILKQQPVAQEPRLPPLQPGESLHPPARKQAKAKPTCPVGQTKQCVKR